MIANRPDDRSGLAWPSSGYDSPGLIDFRSPLTVIACGLVTTGLTLLGIFFLSQFAGAGSALIFSLEITYYGAIGLGMAAASGYVLGASFLNLRVGIATIWVIAVLQLAAYFAGSFISFRCQGPVLAPGTDRSLTFWEYYHLETIEMTWESTVAPNDPARYLPKFPHGLPISAPPDKPAGVGLWGYAIRLLEIGGFDIGGIVILLYLRNRPYCETCQKYMKNRTLLMMPAAAKLPWLRLNNKFDMESPRHKVALAAALAAIEETTEALQGDDVRSVRRCIRAYNFGAGERVPLIAVGKLAYCPRCLRGCYSAELKGNREFESKMAGMLGEHEVPRKIVAEIVARRLFG